jgi:hypothetical protein
MTLRPRSLPNDSISSLVVGNGVRAVLFEHDNFGGEQSLYEPGSYAHVGRNENDKPSSIRVTYNNGSRATWHYLGENPSNYDGKWYNNVQGLAHSDSYWYITQETQIWQYDIGADLTGQEIRLVTMPWQLSQHGCSHFGDPHFYNGYLFVPVEKCFGGQGAYLAVFDANLTFICWDQLYKQANNASWFAVNPASGLGYSAGVTLNDTSPVHAYTIDWNSIYPDDEPHWFLYDSSADIWLLRQDYSFADLANPQGGVFSDDGKLLYMTNGTQNCNEAGADNGGMRVFHAGPDGLGGAGLLQAKAGQAYGYFEYENHCGWYNYEEPEGMDYVDMDVRPGPYWGQLHVLLLQNFPGDKAHLKHYSMW